MDSKLIAIVLVLAGLLLLGCTNFGGTKTAPGASAPIPAASSAPANPAGSGASSPPSSAPTNPSGGGQVGAAPSFPSDITADAGINDSLSNLDALQNASAP